MLAILKTKRFLIPLTSTLFLFLLTLTIILVGRTEEKTPSNSTKEVQKRTEFKVMRGFNLAPKSFSNSDFNDFLDKIKGSSALTWAGDWNELGNKNSAAYTLTKLAKKYDFEPIVIVGIFHQGSGALLRPLNKENLEKYISVAVKYVQETKPNYLGLGLEINLLYEKDPENFERFVQLFEDTYLEIKSVSKETKVFVTFQLEKLKGLHGGLFGGTNDSLKNQWFLLDLFPNADLIGLTTYPSLIYKSPSDLVEDYYSETSTKTGKKIAFVEIGWPAHSKVKGWETDESEQALFVDRFFRLTEKTSKEIEIWPFIYDPAVPEPFSTLGLVNQDGTERPAYKQWLSHN